MNLFDVSPDDEEDPVRLAIGDEDDKNVFDAGVCFYACVGLDCNPKV